MSACRCYMWLNLQSCKPKSLSDLGILICLHTAHFMLMQSMIQGTLAQIAEALTPQLVDVAVSLFGKLLQTFLEFCIVDLFCGRTVCRMAVMRQLQQACDSLLVGLRFRNLCEGRHCRKHARHVTRHNRCCFLASIAAATTTNEN